LQTTPNQTPEPVWPTTRNNPRQLTIESSLDGKAIDIIYQIRGTLGELCCAETVWILIQRVGGNRLYPRGWCRDIGGGLWKACDGSGTFGSLGPPGASMRVTAVVIHDGSEEEAYINAATNDGFAFDGLPSSPVSISNTITVEIP
jgi:hypothetical protein